MKTNITIAVVSLGLSAAFNVSAPAADATPANKPNADLILRQMSARLSAARQFSFHAHREIDAALLAGRNVPESARIEVTVQRPNKLMATSTSKDGTRRFYANGQTLSLLDAKMNLYATVPMHTSLDGLVDRIDEKYGFIPPLAEFALSNPYQEFRRQAQTISYTGREKVGAGFLGLGGVECHRLSLKGKVADAELWVSVSDQLPRKLVATFKNREGKPQLKVELSDWNLAAKVTGNEFTFVPPKGAMKIPMRTTAEMGSTTHKKK